MISVVISTLDRPALLRQCLDALIEGTMQPDEVVVVDQGDANGVARVVEGARERGLQVVHVTQAARGLSRSQNEGVRAATSPVVAVIDDDCVAAPDWIEVIHRTFSGHDAPDLVGGRILPGPIEGDRTVAVSTRAGDQRIDFDGAVAPWLVGSGGNFATRRDLFLAVGGNDERLGTGAPGRAGNDLDLFHRLMRAGARARYVPDMLVHHRRSTPAERRARRGSYGFGVGACVGRWLRDGDGSALRVLGAWIALRARTLRRKPSLATFADEARIAAGTVAGVVHGLRLGVRWPPEGA